MLSVFKFVLGPFIDMEWEDLLKDLQTSVMNQPWLKILLRHSADVLRKSVINTPHFIFQFVRL